MRLNRGGSYFVRAAKESDERDGSHFQEFFLAGTDGGIEDCYKPAYIGIRILSGEEQR